MNKYKHTFDNNNIFKYKSVCRKIHKKNKNLVGLVNEHHIIPKSLKKHKLLKITNYKINQNYNLFIMPNNVSSVKKLNLRKDIMIHIGGHLRYNNYVKKNLDNIYKYKKYDERCYYLWLFIHYLKKNLKYNEENIPWN